MSKKIYCGIVKTTKGYRAGSMVECLEKGKVNLYGLHKIDSKLVKQKLDSKKKESKKDKSIKEMDVQLTQSALKGKITAFNREVTTLEKEDDDRNLPLIKKIKKQIDITNTEIKKLSEIIKKIRNGVNVKIDLKAVEKKIPTVNDIKGIKKIKKATTKKSKN